MGRLGIFLFFALIAVIVILVVGAYNILKLIEAIAIGLLLIIIGAVVYSIFGGSSKKNTMPTYKTSILSRL